ncbi:MAG: polysaccharide deacetylase family protein [Bacteroidota bacterium]
MSPARRDDAQIVVAAEPCVVSSRLCFRVDPEAVCTSGRVELADLAGLEVGGERWPLPVGPAGEPAADPSGGIDADVLGSAFWWLAGVQEHATVERDHHGRFPYAVSLQAGLATAYGNEAPGTARRPAVDAYRQWLADALRQLAVEIPGRSWGGAPWALALTHDVDALDAGRLRGLVGETRRGRPIEALRRAAGPNERRASLEALIELAKQRGVRSTVFVKAGASTPQDVPYRLGGRTGIRLRELAAEGFEIGLHPSYAAADHPRQLETEHVRLAAVLGARATTVRTHFLRWFDPLTPRLMETHGFQIDSSLGFSETPGFRRGTSHPFRLYDLHADRVTDLWEMPLAVMDTTLFDHQGLSDADALAQALAVCEAAQRAGGVAVVLWHNLLGDAKAWTRRLDVLHQILDHAKGHGAHIGSLASCLPASPVLDR